MTKKNSNCSFYISSPRGRGKKVQKLIGKIVTFLLLFALITNARPAFSASVYQDTNRFTYGFKRLMGAPFQIPVETLRGTLYGPFITGTIGGIFQGTYQTVGDLVGGVFDMGAAASPYAKYALLF